MVWEEIVYQEWEHSDDVEVDEDKLKYDLLDDLDALVVRKIALEAEAADVSAGVLPEYSSKDLDENSTPASKEFPERTLL